MDESASSALFLKRPRAGRPSVAEAALRTEMLLKMALEVFLEMGYQRASIDEIARRANTSKQTLYARFPAKADLFREIVRILSSQLHRQIEDILIQDADPRVVLMHYAENLAALVSNPEVTAVHRIVIGAASEFPGLAEQFWSVAMTGATSHLSGYLGLLNQQGLLRISDTDHAAEVFEGLCVPPLFVMRTIMGLKLSQSPSQQYRHFQEAIRIFFEAYAPSPESTGKRQSQVF